MDTKIKIGDVVVLKSWESNCTKMTVELIDTYNSLIGCVWFDGSNKLHRNTFNPDSLKIVRR